MSGCTGVGVLYKWRPPTATAARMQQSCCCMQGVAPTKFCMACFQVRCSVVCSPLVLPCQRVGLWFTFSFFPHRSEVCWKVVSRGSQAAVCTCKWWWLLLGQVRLEVVHLAGTGAACGMCVTPWLQAAAAAAARVMK